uniref:Uncharacterized protein n=1 Tax=Medicago truncatula TaxID=3880 RepID=I3S454_MEDTR|nr:unknown [Medicago truncatula]
MVLIQHRSSTPIQIPSLKLRFQIPNFPHHVSHDSMFLIQLRCNRVVQNGSNAIHAFSSSIL